jgi:hypothetical protein
MARRIMHILGRSQPHEGDYSLVRRCRDEEEGIDQKGNL